MKSFKFLKFFTIFLFLSLPFFISADDEVKITSINEVKNVLNYILKILYTCFFIIAAIYIILAAYSFLTTSGDEKKVEIAKKKLEYAVIAIIIALLALSVKEIILNILEEGVKNQSTSTTIMNNLIKT